MELRSKAAAEVTSFLDDEIGTKLDILSRQVARIESRLHTYHEVCIQERLSKVLITKIILKLPIYCKPLINWAAQFRIVDLYQSPHRYPAGLFPPAAEHILNATFL